MKILYNPGRFNGGAPLSLLEYADIAKDIGHDVFAIGEYATCQDEYIKLGIQTIETE